MIIRGASLMRAGMMGIVSCLICDVVSYFINEKKDFVDLKGIWNCCLDGAKQAAEIAIPPLPAASSSTSSPVRPLWPPTFPPSSAASAPPTCLPQCSSQ